MDLRAVVICTCVPRRGAPREPASSRPRSSRSGTSG